MGNPPSYNFPNGTKSVIRDLVPDTTYRVQVAAVTRKGDGSRSPVATVTMPGGVPTKPTISLK